MPINPSAPQHKRCAERSFPTNDLRGLGDCIQDHAYTFQPSRSMLEYGCSINQHGTLRVHYHSGCCLVQGNQSQSRSDLLNQVVAEDEQQWGFL